MPAPDQAPRHLLKPAMRVTSVLEIDLVHLREAGIRGFIFDLDDTLVHALDPHAEPGVCEWISVLQEEFKLYIVSNNFSHNRVQIAAMQLGLPFVHQARKPSRKFFRHAFVEMALSASEVAIVGDQLFTDVLGGNRAGALTILVDPISKERKWHRKVMRTVERAMINRHAPTYHVPAHVVDTDEVETVTLSLPE